MGLLRSTRIPCCGSIVANRAVSNLLSWFPLSSWHPLLPSWVVLIVRSQKLKSLIPVRQMWLISLPKPPPYTGDTPADGKPPLSFFLVRGLHHISVLPPVVPFPARFLVAFWVGGAFCASALFPHSFSHSLSSPAPPFLCFRRPMRPLVMQTRLYYLTS